ncbi:D-2-hydroxyacid dehydrogenase [uncultured Shewanella sp.]|uniref:D-2-hydroxyacid dehydrogenase n=1 Tax=uncultured Shewanella sp. TaxID=173975 RepID=UPI00263741ED|nr:D-2-hydroxyacid dehydrogenase [uncultured Shewanella sp.]
MKIVILDAYTLNKGDLSWQGLTALGELTCYDRTASHEVLSRAKEVDVILTNKVKLSADILIKLPRLRYIGVLATGVNVIDLAAASAQGIVVTNAPNYASDSVAQMVFAHILHFSQQVAKHDQAVKAGAWRGSLDFSLTLSPLHSLKNKVLGLIGFGHIAQKVAKIGLAFDMQVRVYSRRQKTHDLDGVIWQSFDEVIAGADFLSLHCPLTLQTERLIDAQCLAKMKPSAVLINTARGELIDEMALAAALSNGTLAFAGLDVLSIEPPANDHPFFALNNIALSPHNAWATLEARQELLAITVANLTAYIEGGTLHNQVA